MKGIIYKYTGPTGKCYIGQTTRPASRKSEHKNAKDNTYFHKAIRKYGFDNFKYEVLYEFDLPASMLKSTLDIMEIRMIEEHNAEYNLTKGGGGTIGYKQSEEQRKNISERMQKSNPMKNPEIAKKSAKSKIGTVSKYRQKVKYGITTYNSITELMKKENIGTYKFYRLLKIGEITYV